MEDQVFYAAAARFESARRLECLPRGNRMASIHGHSFVARVRIPRLATVPGRQEDHVHYLRQQLEEAVAPLDYSDLNCIVERPTVVNLASWLQQRLGYAGEAVVGVQSTSQSGATITGGPYPSLWRQYILESAHQLPHVPEGHKCGQMHGHTFMVMLHADQGTGLRGDDDGWGYLDNAWRLIRSELNYVCLNDVRGLENPTSELLSSWIWTRLKPDLPELRKVTVRETAGSGAQYDGIRYQIWKDMSFDSALQLQAVPDGDGRRRMHGHTYRLRLYLSAPLDELMGWVVDFGDVKKAFKPTLKMLDHRHLNQVLDESNPSTENVARWIKEQVQHDLPQLNGIEVNESPACGTLLTWENGLYRPADLGSSSAGMPLWD